ncbi:MAG: Uncharacterized protein Athens101426_360 [Parcubacteria group bacterium Athens1014_26]|nr:MAG: Uncharacterized protein Athens101426_360 [Parcubacteria group bacterium Athens1014_26]
MSGLSLLEKSGNPADVDTSNFKVWTLAILGTLFSSAVGFLSKIYINAQNSPYLLYLITISLLFLVVFFFQSILIKSGKINFLIVTAESISLILFFLDKTSLLLIITLIINIILFWSANSNGRNIIKNQIKIRFKEIVSKTIPPAVTALSIFISIIYASSLYSNKQIISESALKSLLAPTESVIQKFSNIKDFSFNMTASQLTGSLTMSNLDPGQKAAISGSATAKKELDKKVFQGLQQQAKNYGVNLDPNKTITQTFSGFLNDKFAGLANNFKILIIMALGFLIFLTIKGTVTLLHWPIYLFIYLIYEILTALGFIKISLQSRNQEIIVM